MRDTILVREEPMTDSKQEHTPAAASDVRTAELAEELGRMLGAYAAASGG